MQDLADEFKAKCLVEKISAPAKGQQLLEHIYRNNNTPRSDEDHGGSTSRCMTMLCLRNVGADRPVRAMWGDRYGYYMTSGTKRIMVLSNQKPVLSKFP